MSCKRKGGPLVREIHPEFDSEEDYEMGVSDSREDKEEEPVIADKEAMDSFEPRRSARNVVAKNYSYPSIPTQLKFLSGKRKRGFEKDVVLQVTASNNVIQ